MFKLSQQWLQFPVWLCIAPVISAAEWTLCITGCGSLPTLMSSPWGWACASGGGTVLLFWKPEFVNCAWLQLTQAAAPAWLLLAAGAGPRAAWPTPEPSGGQGTVAAEAAVCSQGELPPRPGLGGSTSMVRMVQVSHTQPILLPGNGAVSVSVSPCGRKERVLQAVGITSVTQRAG